MKKICYVTTVSSTLDSFVLPIVGQLVKETDWEITLICSEDATFEAKLPAGVRYIPISMKRGISLGGIGAMLKMRKIFRKEKFDLVQYSTPNASLYASMAAKMAKVPVRLYCQWGIAYVGFSGMKRKIFKAVEKFVCRNSTQIEPDSFGNLRFSREEGLYSEEKSRVVWNGSASGVSLAKFDISHKDVWRQEIRSRHGVEDDAFVYGFVGRITRDKGIDELFAAYQKLCAEKENTYLMLVGRKENEQMLNQQLLAWAQENPRVVFCGQSSEVEKYMSAMDVYILPSYREGFGSAVVEAEAMGVSVIVSDIPGPTDAMLPEQTGLVVKKADVDTLHQAMVRIFEDSDLCCRLGQQAARFATENFEQKELAKFILEDRKDLMNI
jgi:glycosyltransferase involved in cell wall biosynthesis